MLTLKGGRSQVLESYTNTAHQPLGAIRQRLNVQDNFVQIVKKLLIKMLRCQRTGMCPKGNIWYRSTKENRTDDTAISARSISKIIAV